MRLYQYLKHNTFYTKSEINLLFKENKIMINNEVFPLTWMVKPGDVVTVNNIVIEEVPHVYYLYNKPRGIRCDITNEAKSYINHLSLPYKVVPAGRLDVDSMGLVLLTNDGALIKKCKDSFEKVYLVKLKNPLTSSFIKELSKPITIKGKLTNEMKVDIIDDYQIKLTLSDGKYHQIRRAVINAGNRVEELKRIAIGPFNLDDLAEGNIKEISFT